MLDKKKLEEYLDRCMDSQADFAEIYEEKELSETISMLNGEVEGIDTNNVFGIGIRLYKGLQAVYGYANEMNDETLIPLIEDLKDALGKENKDSHIALERV